MNSSTATLILLTVFTLCLRSAAFAEPTPSPALLVTNTKDNTLVIADPKDGHTVASIPLGVEPHEIAASPDSKLALVSNYSPNENTISLIDLKAQKEINRYHFPYQARPNSVAWADGKFYVTEEDANSVGRYDPATNSIDAQIGVGQATSHMLVYNPANRSVILSSRGSDSVSFIEPSSYNARGVVKSNWRVTTIPAVHRGEAIDLSPDHKEVWVAEFEGGNVVVIDADAKKVTGSFELPNLGADRLKFTPDGKRVLISDITKGYLVVVDTETHAEVTRLKLGAQLEGVNIVPDGSTAFVATPKENAVAIVDLKTLSVTGHISVGSPLSIVWIP